MVIDEINHGEPTCNMHMYNVCGLAAGQIRPIACTLLLVSVGLRARSELI